MALVATVQTPLRNDYRPGSTSQIDIYDPLSKTDSTKFDKTQHPLSQRTSKKNVTQLCVGMGATSQRQCVTKLKERKIP